MSSCYISKADLNQREHQSLGLAQFLGRTKFRYLYVEPKFLFQSGCLGINLLFESEIPPFKGVGEKMCDTH